MTKLTEYDYEYLKGNEKFWPAWGAALAVVSNFCRGRGFGGFGEPTELGKTVMEEYEREELF